MHDQITTIQVIDLYTHMHQIFKGQIHKIPLMSELSLTIPHNVSFY